MASSFSQVNTLAEHYGRNRPLDSNSAPSLVCCSLNHFYLLDLCQAEGIRNSKTRLFLLKEKEGDLIMSRNLPSKRIVAIVSCVAIAVVLAVFSTTSTSFSQDLTGNELLSVARVAHGGPEYAGLRYLTAYGDSIVSFTAFGVTPLGTGVITQAQVRLSATDYQDSNMRRRLDIASPSLLGVVQGGPTFLVYTGSEGGGMFLGSRFTVNEVVLSRQWAMMGFSTLNLAANRSLPGLRDRDEILGGIPHYVVEVVFNPNDTVRYWINKNTFLISKVSTRNNGITIIEEDRSDYRRVSCLMLPYHIVTRLRGQQFADVVISRYDLQSEVPVGRFVLAP